MLRDNKTPAVNTQQANYTAPTPFPDYKIPITPEVWQTLMEQLSKTNQDKELLKKAYKKKAQLNQVLVPKVTKQNWASTTKIKVTNKRHR